LNEQKAGLAPAFLFWFQRRCCLLPPSRHGFAVKSGAIQQTVDGLHGTLEIESRSSYVPSAPIGVRSGFPEDARLKRGADQRAWKCRYG
jgi:hypothetical protein